jgi:hypothetical protein
MRSIDFTDADGKRWYDLSSAARLLDGLVTNVALRRWAVAGKTTWGLPLEIRRNPLLRTGHAPARSQRQYRLVISDDSVRVLYEMLSACRSNAPNPLTKVERSNLEFATRKHQNFFRFPTLNEPQLR